MSSRWLSCAGLAVALLAALVVAWSRDKGVRKSDMEMDEGGGRMKKGGGEKRK